MKTWRAKNVVSNEIDPQHIRDGNVKANTGARIRAWGCVVEGLVKTPSPLLLGERGVEGKGHLFGASQTDVSFC